MKNFGMISKCVEINALNEFRDSDSSLLGLERNII